MITTTITPIIIITTGSGLAPPLRAAARGGARAAARRARRLLPAAVRADHAARYAVRISNAEGAVVVEVGELIVVDQGEAMPWL